MNDKTTVSCWSYGDGHYCFDGHSVDREELIEIVAEKYGYDEQMGGAFADYLDSLQGKTDGNPILQQSIL